MSQVVGIYKMAKGAIPSVRHGFADKKRNVLMASTTWCHTGFVVDHERGSDVEAIRTWLRIQVSKLLSLFLVE